MNSHYAVQCETRAELDACGIAIVLLSSILFFFVFGSVMAAREGSAPDLSDLAVVTLFCAGYVAFLAWVAFRVREWVVLGDATLFFSPARPRVGERFVCRMQFERPSAARDTARAELVCQVSTRTGSGSKEKFRTRTLWRDTQTAHTAGPLQFKFDPPADLPPAEKSIGTEVRWWLKVRGQGNNRFRRRFRVPLGPRASGERDDVRETFEAGLAVDTPARGPRLGRAFKVIYSLCGVLFLANAGLIAWGLADHFQIGQSGAPELEGRLRLGDLRQTSTSEFAAQLDGRFAWQRGSLSVQADSLRLRAWDCEGPCPRVKEFHLTLWHYTEDEPGALSGRSVAHSDPVTIDELPQDGVALDLGSRAFSLRFRGNHDPRQLALTLEVQTEKTTHQFGQRFGGASNLLGLVQNPGEVETCGKVKGPVAALEHFCHERVADLVSEVEAPAERRRLLFLAVSRGNAEAVRALLAAEVPVDPVNRRGYTPLMEAVFADLPQIAAVLLEAGADPNFVANASSPYGSDTPLGAALTAGAQRSVRVLLDKGADSNATHGGSPIIHVAVAADLPEVLGILAKKGANLNARAPWGNQPTPLMAAAGTGKLQAVDKLLELGADPAAADSNGNTARDYAATHRRREVLERLKSFPGRCPLTGC
jgi:ankyrin repeat protein